MVGEDRVVESFRKWLGERAQASEPVKEAIHNSYNSLRERLRLDECNAVATLYSEETKQILAKATEPKQGVYSHEMLANMKGGVLSKEDMELLCNVIGSPGCM
jgi:hypothetical protein